MMQQVIFIEGASQMGGVQFSTLYLAQNLDQDLGQPLIVLPGKGAFFDECEILAVPVEILRLPRLVSTSIRLGRDHRFPNPLAWLINIFLFGVGVFRLVRYLKQKPVGLIVTKGMASHFYGGMAAKIRGLPCLWHVQDFISERYLGIYRWFFNLSARCLADKLVVDGSPIADQIWQSLQPRVEVVLNGVDISTFSPTVSGSSVRSSLGIPADAVVIGNVARITPWKGQDHILHAFEKAAKQNSDIFLVLVGSPVFDNDVFFTRLKEIHACLDSRERVIFAGYRRDLPQVLNAFDIFAYTAVEKDTSPLSLLSALACGLPTVAFDIPGIREVLGNDGLLVSVGDRSALSGSLLQLSRDQALRMDLASRARKKAVSEFSLERYSQKMACVMRGLSSSQDDGQRGSLR
jgi:glycosyltransferase involved in cell wall biosynthesis